MYGLTECKRVCYLPPVDLDRKPGSVGLAIPNSEIFVLNAAGEVAAPGEEGELVVRGAHVMQGYWRDPELSAKRLRAGILPGERWLYTGDIFRRDADGYLYFIGRSDDMIKSRGEKVSPREIEELLFRAPGVTGAAVIGVADPLLGHAAIAFVSCKEEKQASTRELLKFLKSELEDYKIPKQIIILPNLPRTENSKIDKLALKQFYGDMQNAQAASMASL
jgi:acyl-coenzyme A synthetase/AMP-(fatty) acid ligase